MKCTSTVKKTGARCNNAAKTSCGLCGVHARSRSSVTHSTSFDAQTQSTNDSSFNSGAQSTITQSTSIDRGLQSTTTNDSSFNSGVQSTITRAQSTITNDSSFNSGVQSMIDDSSFETRHQCAKASELRKIGYSSLEDWMNDNRNVYVGRAGRIWITDDEGKRMFRYSGSKFCNPHLELDAYIGHIENTVLNSYIEELRGKNLGCFCLPSVDCHAKILADMINASSSSSYGVYDKYKSDR